MKFAETFGIRGLGFLEVPDWTVAEEEAEHGTHAPGCDRQPGRLGSVLDAAHQLLSGGGEFVVGARLLEKFQSLDPGSHRERIAAQRAGLIHRPRRSHHRHDVGPTAVGTNRQTSTDHLPHRGEVGCDTEVSLSPAIADAETRHHFIEHQQGAVFLGEFAQSFEEAWFRLDEAGVSNNRFENHTRDRIGILGEKCLDGLQIVVRGCERVGRGAPRHAGGIGQPQGGHSGTGLDEEHVGVAVVAALELDHLVATGVSPHQTEHGHAGFRAAVDETNHLHAGDGLDDHFRQGVLQGAGGSKARSLLNRLLKRCDHFRVGMSADGRSPAADVIDVFVPVHVPCIGPLDPVEHEGLAANRFEGAHRGTDASRHEALGFTEDGLGAGGVQRGCCHGDRRQGGLMQTVQHPGPGLAASVRHVSRTHRMTPIASLEGMDRQKGNDP